MENDKIIGRPVKLNKVQTGEKSKLLVPVGDVHFGAINCDVKKFQECLEFCRSKNAWILLMGDLLESSSRYSIGAGVDLTTFLSELKSWSLYKRTIYNYDY